MCVWRPLTALSAVSVRASGGGGDDDDDDDCGGDDDAETYIQDEMTERRAACIHAMCT